MSSIILCNLSDANQYINEAKLQWVCNVLQNLGVPEEVYTSDIDAYRQTMSKMGIEVEIVTNGGVNIYKQTWHEGKNGEERGWVPVKEENLIAQWKEPTRIIKVEGQETFYEIHLNEWSILKTRQTHE